MTDTRFIKLVRSDGAELQTYDRAADGWVIEIDGLDGFGGVEIEVNSSENVIRDGSSLKSKRVAETYRTLKGIYTGSLSKRQAKDQITSFFNSDYSFEAHILYEGVTRWIEGKLSGFKCDPVRESLPLRFIAEIKCLDPYFKSEYRNDRAFTDSIPMFGFPFISHAEEDTERNKDYPAGCVPSIRTFDGKNTIYNDGDVPCPFCAIVKAKGAIVNPTIVKDDKHIRMVTTMLEGDELIIDFEPEQSRVTLNGENIINRASRDSSFSDMDMQTGVNVFSFECDNEESAALADVRILFNAKYLGV